MKIELVENKECLKKVSVEIPWMEIDQKATEIAKNFQRHAQLHGFRPGKAPVTYIKRLFAKDIKSEILNDIVPKTIKDYVEQEHLRLAADPDIKDLIYAEQCPLTYTIEFEIIPHFELKGYRGIEIKKDKIDVENQEIEDKINELQQKEAHLVPVENRTAQLHDYVLVTFSLPKESVPEGDPGTFDSSFILGAPEVLDELNHIVPGMKIGEQKEFEMEPGTGSLPEQHEKKKMRIIAELKEIKEIHLPSPEDIMKNLGQFADSKDFKKHVKNLLIEEKEKNENEVLKDKITYQLAQDYNFEVPHSLLKNQLGYLIRRWKEKLAHRNIALPSALMKTVEIFKELEAKAEKDIRSTLVLEEIAKDQKLELSADAINAKLEQLAKDSGMNAIVLKSKLESSGDYEQLLSNWRREATLDFLLQHATII